MATKKQRSRRAKTFRHDYALVVNDEEGNEVEVSSSALKGKKPEGAKNSAKPSSGGGSSTRRGTPPPQPSWQRALKRGGLMGAGLAILLVFFLHSPIILGVVYGVLFVPLTYWMDRLTYNWWQKRQNPSPGAKPPPRKGR
jgi:hypothetical protein